MSIKSACARYGVIAKLFYPITTGIACPYITGYNDHKTVKEKEHPLDDNMLQTWCRERSLLNMVIIKDYSLEYKSDSGFYKVRSYEIIPCPYCDGFLNVCGSRTRGLMKQDGSEQTLVIRRLQCADCDAVHHELPDIIVPYKRYGAEAIANTLTEDITEAEAAFPGEGMTLRRLKLWFYLFHKYFEGALRALKERLSVESNVLLPLYPLKRQADGWLKCLVRQIVNSGLWLQTRSVSTI